MATKKKNLETLRSNYLASKQAYEEAENEQVKRFANLLFDDEELRILVLKMKTSELKQNAKTWSETIKKLNADS